MAAPGDQGLKSMQTNATGYAPVTKMLDCCYEVGRTFHNAVCTFIDLVHAKLGMGWVFCLKGWGERFVIYAWNC